MVFPEPDHPPPGEDVSLIDLGDSSGTYHPTILPPVAGSCHDASVSNIPAHNSVALLPLDGQRPAGQSDDADVTRAKPANRGTWIRLVLDSFRLVQHEVHDLENAGRHVTVTDYRSSDYTPPEFSFFDDDNEPMGCCASKEAEDCKSSGGVPPPPTEFVDDRTYPVLHSPDEFARAALDAAAEAAAARVHDDSHDSIWEENDGAALETLLAPRDGDSPVLLLDARFLIALARRGGRIARRQELPADAFLSFESLRRLPPSFAQRGLRIVCVSYPWLVPGDPDPRGDTLRLLAHALERFVDDENFGKSTSGVFLDFSSLYQEGGHEARSVHQTSLFSHALSNLSILYSHPRNFVVKISRLPSDYPAAFNFPPNSTPNQSLYSDRGWCFCESSLANLVKHQFQVFDLAYFDLSQDTLGVISNKCCLGRSPPLPPDQFDSVLDGKTFSFKGSDFATVSHLYRVAFHTHLAAATRLILIRLGWGDDEICMFSQALPAMAVLKQLSLSDNPFGMRGYSALAAALAEGAAPELRSVVISSALGKDILLAARPGLHVSVTT